MTIPTGRAFPPIAAALAIQSNGMGPFRKYSPGWVLNGHPPLWPAGLLPSLDAEDGLVCLAPQQNLWVIGFSGSCPMV